MSSGPSAPATSRASASISFVARTSSLLHLFAFRPASLSSARSVATTPAPSAMKASAMARPMPWPAAVINATLPCRRFVIRSSCVIFVQGREAEFLPAVAVEIVRRQPALEVRLAYRPLAVEHGEPGVVAVAALGDDVLAERALVDEAVTQRRAPRFRVERIALPFVAPIVERFEHVAGQQILRFGAERRALQRRRIHHMTDLDDPHLRLDAQQREIADGASGGIDDRIRIRVLRRGAHLGKRRKLGEVRERAGGPDIGPDLVVALEHAPQIGRMAGGELLDMAVASLARNRTRPRSRRRIDRQANRLAGSRMRLGGGGHGESFFRSSPKNLFSSALVMTPPKPSNTP